MTAVRKSMASATLQPGGRMMGFVLDDDTATSIQAADISLGLQGDVLRVGVFSETIEYLASLPTPEFLVIDLGSGGEVMPRVEALSEVCDSDTRVILLGEVNDLHLYRELIGLGIADYLVKPVTEKLIHEALDRLMAEKAAAASIAATPSSSGNGKVVAVINVRGGAGASTIAANLSACASSALGKQTMLIDMDLAFGTQAVMFDIDPGSGLSDAMMEPGRMDELFIKRAATRIDDHLKIMVAEIDPGRGDVASAESLSGLLGYIREETEVVIIDLPRATLVAHPGMLDELDRLVLVAEPTLVSMRDCARLKTLISKRNAGAQISFVLNKMGMAGKEELPVATFEEGVGAKTDHRIAFDPKSVMSADAHGQCVVQIAPRARVARDISALATKLLGEPNAEKRGGLGSLLSLFKKRETKSVKETK